MQMWLHRTQANYKPRMPLKCAQYQIKISTEDLLNIVRIADFPRANARTRSPYTLQSLRVYQYRSRVRPIVENVAHP